MDDIEKSVQNLKKSPLYGTRVYAMYDWGGLPSKRLLPFLKPLQQDFSAQKTNDMRLGSLGSAAFETGANCLG